MLFFKSYKPNNCPHDHHTSTETEPTKPRPHSMLPTRGCDDNGGIHGGQVGLEVNSSMASSHPRDRCKSAPDIRSSEQHRNLERMCADELRRISDEFHHSYCVSVSSMYSNLICLYCVL